MPYFFVVAILSICLEAKATIEGQKQLQKTLPEKLEVMVS